MTSESRFRRSRRPGPPGLALVAGTLLVLSGPVDLPAPARGPEGAARAESGERGCERQLVSERVIEEAIRGRRGYDITATPNQGRFLADLLLDLADRYRKRRPSGAPLLIRQQEFFPAFLRVTGLSAEEAPPGFRKAYRYRQRMVVEYRSDRVVEGVRQGPEPRQALSVRAAWPDTGSCRRATPTRTPCPIPTSGSARSGTSPTACSSTWPSSCTIGWRGSPAGPRAGPLGALFDVLGMAEIRQSRFVPAGQGAQVTYSRVRKVAPGETFATVTADGRARRGLPEDRRFHRLRSILERDLAVEYAEEPPPACFTAGAE